MRFGALVVFVIAVGVAIGWLLPTSGFGSKPQPPASVGATAIASRPAPTDADGPVGSTFSDTVFVNTPVHFAYAIVFAQTSKAENAKVIVDRDQRIRASIHEGRDGSAELTFGFAPEGSGTRITIRVDATGQLESRIKEAAADPRHQSPTDKMVEEINKAAAEVKEREPGWTLDRAGDEIIALSNQRKQDRGAEAEAEMASPPAENAAATRS